MLPKLEEHVRQARKEAIRKSNKKIGRVRDRAMQDQKNKDTEALDTIKAIKEHEESLPEREVLSEDTKTDSVLLHLENTGMMKNMNGGLVKAMCDRGLCVVKKEVAGQTDTTLSCAWHKGSEFKSMKEAIEHLETYGYHDREEKEQKLADLGAAENKTVDYQETDDTRNKQEEPERSKGENQQTSAAGLWLQSIKPVGFALGTNTEMISTDTGTDTTEENASARNRADIKTSGKESETDDIQTSQEDNDPCRIMTFTYAIGFIQKVAYTKKGEDHRLPAEWPPEVVDLRNYCERKSNRDQEFIDTLHDIMRYKPTQWKQDSDRFITQLKSSLRRIWKKVLESPVLIPLTDRDAETEWVECFNENFYNLQLPCKVMERKFNQEKTRLVFRPQGLLSTSRYKKVTKTKMAQEEELLHALENCSSG